MRWLRFRHRDLSGTDLEHALSTELLTSLPVPVEMFARYLGVRVEGICGGVSSLTVTAKHASLWVAAGTEAERRYAVAHGLGHLLVGRDGVVHETSEHRHERAHLRAHDFALRLLMPTGSIVAATAVMGENTGALARYYLVPEHVVHARLAIVEGTV